MLSIIVAMTENHVIGKDNKMPWHLPADLRHFKQLTWGHSVIMGRKTFQSIGKALPGRENIVITKQASFQAKDIILAHNTETAITLATHQQKFIIGGAEIFKQVFSQVSRIYLTLIHSKLEGDCFFPEFDWNAWNIVKKDPHAADANNAYPFSFLCLERK
ncbi:MAG: dihydrofolate reductase [Pseudomonadota bacterium]